MNTFSPAEERILKKFFKLCKQCAKTKRELPQGLLRLHLLHFSQVLMKGPAAGDISRCMWTLNQWVSKAEDQTGSLPKQEEHFRDDQEEIF